MVTIERLYYNQLPQYAIIELPQPHLDVLVEFENRCADYGMPLESILDDFLINTAFDEAAEESLNEWLVDTNYGLSEAYGENDHQMDYMNSIGAIFTELRPVMNLLRTPQGQHHYEFHDWLTEGDYRCAVLVKRRFVE